MAKKSQRSQSRREVAWVITRLTGTPATRLGRVYAVDGNAAIAKAIEKFRVPANLHSRLVARRVD